MMMILMSLHENPSHGRADASYEGLGNLFRAELKFHIAVAETFTTLS